MRHVRSSPKQTLGDAVRMSHLGLGQYATSKKTARVRRIRIYLTTIDAFCVGVIDKANQVFQPDDRFCAANSQ